MFAYCRYILTKWLGNSTVTPASLSLIIKLALIIIALFFSAWNTWHCFWKLMGPSPPHKYVTWQVNHCKDFIRANFTHMITWHALTVKMCWRKKTFKWNGVRWMMARRVTFCSEQTGDVQSDRLDSRRLHLTYRKNSGLDIQRVFFEDKKWDGSDEWEWSEFHQYKHMFVFQTA